MDSYRKIKTNDAARVTHFVLERILPCALDTCLPFKQQGVLTSCAVRLRCYAWSLNLEFEAPASIDPTHTIAQTPVNVRLFSIKGVQYEINSIYCILRNTGCCPF